MKLNPCLSLEQNVTRRAWPNLFLEIVIKTKVTKKSRKSHGKQNVFHTRRAVPECENEIFRRDKAVLASDSSIFSSSRVNGKRVLIPISTAGISTQNRPCSEFQT